MTTTQPATLRPATLDDLTAVMALEDRCFLTRIERFNPRQVRMLITNPRTEAWVAQRDRRVVGWAVGLIRQHPRNRSGRLYALAVHPDAQGQHIGTRLTQHIIQALRSRGATNLYLEVRPENHPAIRLYRRLGFAEQSQLPHYYGQGWHGLRMVMRPDTKTVPAARPRRKTTPLVGCLTGAP